MAQYFRYLCASYLCVTAMDKPSCVAYASSDGTNTFMETSTAQHLSPAIESKISAVSYDNPALHTDFCKEDASATSCKIFQTLYLCLTAQYKFNILVSSPLASINTNYILLASSPSTSVKGTESTIDTNVKAAIATDATSGKKKLYKTLYTMNLHLHMHLHILKKNGKKCQRI